MMIAARMAECVAAVATRRRRVAGARRLRITAIEKEKHKSKAVDHVKIKQLIEQAKKTK